MIVQQYLTKANMRKGKFACAKEDANGELQKGKSVDDNR